MAKAEIGLPSGAKVTVEGTEAEVRALIDHYSDKGTGVRAGSRRSQGSSSSTGPASGPSSLIRGLIAEGFFATKRTLGAIQGRLAEQGHIYPQTSLSSVVVKLTKKRELRRLKEKGAWVYVNP